MSKNIQRVQDMLDGNYKNKIQVGYEKTEQKREIGERWFDSDGKEWEQKNGYIASIKKTPDAGLGDQCSDCKSLIVKPWDKEIFKFNDRCYYCQINFEAELKTNGKYKEWEKKQLARVKQQYIEQFEKENKEFIKELEKLDNPFDLKVANAMANENVSMAIKNNKS